MSISAIKKLQGFALSKSKGFTLIELLIVIAVLGVLAAGVLVAINPAEQLARARDASRKTTVGQLNKAAQAYYTSHSAYVAADDTINGWITLLKNAGEIKSVPAVVTYSISGAGACTDASGSLKDAESGFCYITNATKAESVVFVPLESGSEKAKCTVSGEKPYFLWSSTDGKTGVVCSSTEPTALTYTTYL